MSKLSQAALALLASTSPAVALEHPSGDKNADKRVCDVIYDPSDVVDVRATVGEAVTIMFRASERIDYVSASDTAHLKQAETKGSSVLWLKATEPMQPQPISVVTLLEDGSLRNYMLQWSATAPVASAPARVAMTGNAQDVADVVSPQAKPAGAPCYLIRFDHPSDDKAAKDKAARAQWIGWQQKKAEIALRQQPAQNTTHNVHYVGQGDASIGPTEIFDDGFSTWLRFPGNLKVPTIFTITSDGKESELVGQTTEDNGLIKLHGVYQQLRLRDGNLVLCVFNRAFNPLGNDPATGTTSPAVTRDLRASQ
jgi:type IV secretion system protein VirB9